VVHKIAFTEDALTALEHILNPIRIDNEAAAKSFGAPPLDPIEILKDFPRIGTPVRNRPQIRKR